MDKCSWYLHTLIHWEGENVTNYSTALECICQDDLT